VYIAVSIALGMTIVLGLLEILYESRADLRSCLTWPLLIYLFIYMMGNTFATLLSRPAIGESLPADLLSWSPFIYAFAGVFAFQGVIGRTNITFFSQGILTIEDWISKSKSAAVDRALQNESKLIEKRASQLSDRAESYAQEISANIPEERLNAHIRQHMGEGAVQMLEASAQAANADLLFVKSLALAYSVPDQAARIVRQLHEEPHDSLLKNPAVLAAIIGAGAVVFSAIVGVVIALVRS